MSIETVKGNNVEKKERPQNKNLMPPIKKGEVRNPNGRPKGRRDARTVIWEAMQKIAASKDMTAEEVETLLHEAGIKYSLKGNHKFYASITDRLYGPVDKGKNNVTVNVTTETSPEVKELTKKLNDIYRNK